MTIYIRSPIYWSISLDDPKEEIFNYLASTYLINPIILLSQGESFFKNNNFEKLFPFGLVNNKIVFSTRYLIFKTNENDVEKLHQSCGIFLSRIRHSSKQPGIPNGSDGILMLRNINDIDASRGRSPKPDGGTGVIVGRIVDTAITWDIAKQCCNSSKQWRAPLYDTILLDSMEALQNSDYKKSILYSAMAIEVLATTLLDEEYRKAIDEVIKNKNGDRLSLHSGLRITSYNSGDKIGYKDPIYEHLAYGFSGQKGFTRLLHEIPLYLLKRSLLIDNERLYNSATILYRTRNKIIHKGEPSYENKGDCLEINHDGAHVALKCAKMVFIWFGKKDSIPKYGKPLYDCTAIRQIGEEL